MLNLLFQNSSELAQEVYEVYMVKGHHGSLEQVDWWTRKAEATRDQFF
jgi:hypothetical protein